LSTISKYSKPLFIDPFFSDGLEQYSVRKKGAEGGFGQTRSSPWSGIGASTRGDDSMGNGIKLKAFLLNPSYRAETIQECRRLQKEDVIANCNVSSIVREMIN
jgi:hypothetical protein